MKQFSANGSPLPPLAVRISHLAAEPVAVLDRSKVAHPANRVAESFWSVTEQLHEMLAALNFGDLDGQALARRKRSKIGRASCRDSVCWSVYIAGVEVKIKQ